MRALALLSLSLLACGSPSAGSEPRAPAKPETAPGLSVAITVDDLPVHGRPYPGIDRGKIADQLLAAFAAHRGRRRSPPTSPTSSAAKQC